MHISLKMPQMYRPGRITKATSASKLDLLDQLIESFLIKESGTDFLKHQSQLVSEIQLDSDPSLIQIPFYAVAVRACAWFYCILLCLIIIIFFDVPTRSDLSCGETRVWRNYMWWRVAVKKTGISEGRESCSQDVL